MYSAVTIPKPTSASAISDKMMRSELALAGLIATGAGVEGLVSCALAGALTL